MENKTEVTDEEIINIYKDYNVAFETESPNKYSSLEKNFCNEIRTLFSKAETPERVSDAVGYYTKNDMRNAYQFGEKGKTFIFKDTSVILPRNYEGVDG